VVIRRSSHGAELLNFVRVFALGLAV